MFNFRNLNEKMYLERVNILKSYKELDEKLNIYETFINNHIFPKQSENFRFFENNANELYKLPPKIQRGPLNTNCTQDDCIKEFEKFFKEYIRKLTGKNGLNGQDGIKGVKGERGIKVNFISIKKKFIVGKNGGKWKRCYFT